MTEKTARKIRIVIPVAKKADKTTYTVEELYAEYYDYIAGRFGYLLNSPEDGEDLAQDVFEKVIRNWDRIHLHKIEAALAVICHNMRYDYLAKKYNRPLITSIDDILDYDCSDYGIRDPYRILVNRRGLDQIEYSLSVLTDQQRKIFNLYYIDELSASKIADMMGCRASVIYSALTSSRKLIYEICQKPYQGGY